MCVRADALFRVMKFLLSEPPGTASRTAGKARETEPHEPEPLFQNRNRTEPLHSCPCASLMKGSVMMIHDAESLCNGLEAFHGPGLQPASPVVVSAACAAEPS